MRPVAPFWIFCGVTLFSYGTFIFLTGLYELAHPLNPTPLLFSLHSAIWWGGFMGIAGAAYVILHRPKRPCRNEIRTLRYE